MSPSAITVSAGGDTATSATSCSTVTSALASAVPAEAVTFVLPFACAVTRPESVTLATEVLVLVQSGTTSDIAWPSWSYTVASIRMLSSNESRVSKGGDIVILVGSGGSVSVHPGPAYAAVAASRMTACILGNPGTQFLIFIPGPSLPALLSQM